MRVWQCTAIACVAFSLCVATLHCSRTFAADPFRYATTPADNPLKGLVPYKGHNLEQFPCSMEFGYLPLSELLIGEEEYDWQPLDQLLNEVASRRRHAVFRIWLEYPGRKDGVPSYLKAQGLKVVEWVNSNTQPSSDKTVRTPDYEDLRLRKALRAFIAAMGKRYDGDPRIGFITAGLLGTWGEWHTFPRSELMASKTVQMEVLDAYESAFKVTPVLLRYPAGENHYAHAPNQTRAFGYHDDSFAWATLDTGKQADNWFFMPALKAAGEEALQKWKSRPIGGEIRPELWGQIFDDAPQHPQAQNFRKCVDATHVTWLMDTGMFRGKPQSDQRIRNAKQAVAHMGYEFHVTSANITSGSSETQVQVGIANRGVAPFYYDWKIQLVLLNERQQILNTVGTDWKLTKLLPGQKRQWRHSIAKSQVPPGSQRLAIRVVNPLKNGLPLRFANQQDIQLPGGLLQIGALGR